MRVCGWLLAACCVIPVARADLVDLPTPLAISLKLSGLPPADVSVYVAHVRGSTPLAEWNADTPRDPASTMKLLSTFVALDTLGPSYRWKTAIFSNAPVVAGTLKGDLYLKGYADPYFVTESFWDLLHGLHALGVHDIAGNLVVDTSYLQLAPVDEGSFDHNNTEPYNTDPSALSINFQAIDFRFIPDRARGRVDIVADPHPKNISIENHVRLIAHACTPWGRRVGLRVVHDVTGDKVVFYGQYPSGCGESTYYRVVNSASSYVYGVFRELWAEQGGRFSGSLVEAPVPPHARELYEVRSRPLAEILYDINKYSNNLMAREVVMTLGAEKFGLPGTTDKGLAAIRAWLAARGLNFPELVLQNGVGLSRTERISPEHLGDLLALIYQSRYMPEMMASLPLAGRDGTLKDRFRNSPIRGRLHAKTGTLSRVKALAGYLLDHDGHREIVVIINNGRYAESRAERRFEDAVVNWAYAQ